MATRRRVVSAFPAKPSVYNAGLQNGLTSDEARRRLEKFGPNAMPDTSMHPLRMALENSGRQFRGCWRLRSCSNCALGKYVEAAIIAALLVFNAALGLFQESRAQATLAALKSRLALNASVRRDGAWKTVPAVELVPGDVVKLSLGAVVAADVRLTGGEVLLDQSMLTGESVPIEAGAGVQTYAGALVRRGEAVAEVTATGARTKFGRTAELVRTAHVVSSQQKAVLRVVRNLAAFNGVVIAMLVAYAYFLEMPLAEIIPLVLTAVLASIPVALPATFTLASALGAQALAKLGVLSTRLSAVDEAATMNVLCADKTGTLTRNALTVTTVRPMPGFDEAHVLALAALASSDGGQDPVDGAIRAAAVGKAVSDAPKIDQVRAVRSGEEDVGGDSPRHHDDQYVHQLHARREREALCPIRLGCDDQLNLRRLGRSLVHRAWRRGERRLLTGDAGNTALTDIKARGSAGPLPKT